MIVAMPRDGAIIFSDLIGKLDSPYNSGPLAEDPRAVDGTF
jgi:hypothetical protein